jgi:hypothetical protein
MGPLGQVQALLTKQIIMERLKVTNTLAYYGSKLITAVKFYDPGLLLHRSLIKWLVVVRYRVYSQKQTRVEATDNEKHTSLLQ